MLLLGLELPGVVVHVPEQLHVDAAVREVMHLYHLAVLDEGGGGHHIGLPVRGVGQIPDLTPLALHGRRTHALPAHDLAQYAGGALVLVQYLAPGIDDEDAAHIIAEEAKQQIINAHVFSLISV